MGRYWLSLLAFAGCCLIVLTNRAVSQTPPSLEVLPNPKIKKNDVPSVPDKGPDPAIAELRKSLKQTNDELARMRSIVQLSELKAGTKNHELEKALAEAKTTNEKLADEAAKGTKKSLDDLSAKATTATERGDTAWMLMASALVLLMVPGLALFYGGMVRRKNVLATMMQSMAALAVVGIYWIIIGYSLAFGASLIKFDFLGVKDAGFVGWSWDLVCLKGIPFDAKLPGNNIPIYAHVMFQGMFAIITPALISGAIAERIRFWPFCIFMLLWVTFVYCPLAHMVWAFDWFDTSVLAAKRGGAAIGFLGKMGALDFAGGTVVHIAAGLAGLACCIVLGKRAGYPQQVAHPNSMVLTLLGAGLLWFGWFGFNGGSAINSSAQAVSAFAATQAAAAAAGLGWMVVEWLHKGKPTALGLASGVVAGLVAVTPASGFVYMWGGMLIGLAASIVCYFAVTLKSRFTYDDSLDAFGVHGVGGFIGAVLTGVFATSAIYPDGGDGPFAYHHHRARMAELKANDQALIKEAKAKSEAADKELAEAEVALKATPESEAAKKALAEKQDLADDASANLKSVTSELEGLEKKIAKQDDVENEGKDKKSSLSQIFIQFKAAIFSTVFAFSLSILLVIATQAITHKNFKTDAKGESEGLDRTEHGEVGFDFGLATESVTVVTADPKAAEAPRGNGRFDLELAGADHSEIIKVWTDLCQPTPEPADPDFLAVYPYVTTIRGMRFRCRGGKPEEMAKRLSTLFSKQLGKEVVAKPVA